MPEKLQTFDFFVLIVYMLGVFGLGCWFARKSRTTTVTGYWRGGSLSSADNA